MQQVALATDNLIPSLLSHTLLVYNMGQTLQPPCNPVHGTGLELKCFNEDQISLMFLFGGCRKLLLMSTSSFWKYGEKLNKRRAA